MYFKTEKKYYVSNIYIVIHPKGLKIAQIIEKITLFCTKYWIYEWVINFNFNNYPKLNTKLELEYFRTGIFITMYPTVTISKYPF